MRLFLWGESEQKDDTKTQRLKEKH